MADRSSGADDAAGSSCADASRSIDALFARLFARLGGWRGMVLTRVRQLIHEAVPDVAEELKWRKPSNPDGVPTWSHGGLICTGETYKDKVKLTFPKGASLHDPSALFNASLDGKVRRAIDIAEGSRLDPAAFKALVRAAVDLNAAGR